MGRGRQKRAAKEFGGARLPGEMWDHVDQVGNGNRTKGLIDIIALSIANNDVAKEPDQVLMERIRKHIHAPESVVLREKYFMFIDECFKDRSKIWNAPMIYTLFGMTKNNGANVKKSLKQLVNTGFIKYSINGFKPNIQGNGGWTPEKFDIQLTQYIEMLESRG